MRLLAPRASSSARQPLARRARLVAPRAFVGAALTRRGGTPLAIAPCQPDCHGRRLGRRSGAREREVTM